MENEKTNGSGRRPYELGPTAEGQNTMKVTKELDGIASEIENIGTELFEMRMILKELVEVLRGDDNEH